MTPDEYQQKAVRTDLPQYDLMRNRLNTIHVARLLHAAMGIDTESGEFMDMLKKHILYGKIIDYINLKEELGDLLWYIALALDELGSSFDEVFNKNIAKLKARYPNKFTEQDAIIRNLHREREILEGKE